MTRLQDADVRKICEQFTQTTVSDYQALERDCGSEKSKNLKIVEKVLSEKTDLLDSMIIFPKGNGPACRKADRVAEQMRLRIACFEFYESQKFRCKDRDEDEQQYFR